MNSNIRTIIVAVVTAVIAVLAYSQITAFFDRRHQLETQRQDIQKTIAESTAGATELLELETKQTSITYGEIFERGDDRVKKLTDTVILIATSQLPADEKADLKAYLDGLADALRLQIAKYRKELAVSTSIDSVKREEEIFNSDYSNSYALNALSNARQDLVKAIAESGDAGKNFAASLNALRISVNTIRPKLSDYSLIDDTMLVAAISRNTRKPNVK